jgi:putrescine aminotransferase
VWKKGYKGVEKATLHSSTFGGNTLACAVAIAAIEVILEENMIKNAEEMGKYLLTKLKEQMKSYPLVKDVRGKGLLIGMEFNQFEGFLNAISGGFVGKMANEYTGSMVAGELLNKHNIITAYTLNNPNVIRFEPPLTIGKEEIDQLLNALHKILKDSKGFIDLVLSAGKSFAKSKFAIKGDE